jgi:hypothetical protein
VDHDTPCVGCTTLQEFDVSAWVQDLQAFPLLAIADNIGSSQNFAAVMSVSEDLLCSFELLKVTFSADFSVCSRR